MKSIKYIYCLILLFANLQICKSQHLKYGEKILPKVKKTLDSLYPNYKYSIIQGGMFTTDTSQGIEVTGYNIIPPYSTTIVFDTNGNIYYKDIRCKGIKDLPDTIVNYLKNKLSASPGFNMDSIKVYMQKNELPKCGYFKDYIIKTVNSKGEIKYKVLMWECRNSESLWDYWLTFKSTGEFVSKVPVPAVRQ